MAETRKPMMRRVVFLDNGTSYVLDQPVFALLQSCLTVAAADDAFDAYAPHVYSDDRLDVWVAVTQHGRVSYCH